MTVSISAIQKLIYVKTSSDFRYASTRSIEALSKKTNVVFKEMLVLIGEDNAESPPRALPVGEYVYAFRLEIPCREDTAQLATFDAKISEEYKFKCTCSLDAFVGRKGLFTKNLHEDIPIKVCPFLGGDLPSLQVPIAQSCDSKVSRWCCCTNGTATLHFDQTPQVFFADTLQKISFQLKNPGGPEPKRIKLYLKNELIINPIHMMFLQTKKIKIYDGEWVGDKPNEETWATTFSASIVCNIQNPQAPCLTYSNCGFARLKAWLTVEMSFDGGYSADFLFPVLLATLPPDFAHSERQRAINNAIISKMTSGKGWFAM